MKKITKDIKLQSYEDLFKSTQESLTDLSQSQVMEISIAEIYDFKNHPFRVLDDEKMLETVASIRVHGVLVPVIVRQRMEGGYEMISGHRRKRACEIAGIKMIPAVVKELTDDEATILMIDSNIQREELLISEKAKAYKMKFDAEKHQGKPGGSTLEIMGRESGESKKTIQRYIRLSHLSDGLLHMVDQKKLGFRQGTDFSFLSAVEQSWVEKIIEIGKINVSMQQSEQIKKIAQEGKLTFNIAQEILSPVGKQTRKISLNEKKLSYYFDDNYSAKDIEKIIYQLLDEWKGETGHGNSEK